MTHDPVLAAVPVPAGNLSPGGVLATGPAGRYLDWGVVHISATNAAIVLAMLVLFALAIALPFPGTEQAPEATPEPGDGDRR